MFALFRQVIFACPLVLVLCSCTPSVTQVSGPIQQEAYVWQRSWTRGVSEAVTEHAGEFRSLVVLAAEATWKESGFEVAHVALDYEALRSAKTAIGVALRIGPYPGPFASTGPGNRLCRRCQIRAADMSPMTPN